MFRNRGLQFCIIGLCSIVIIVFFHDYLIKKGPSYNNKEYYSSEEFIDAACQAYSELVKDYSHFTWLYKNVEAEQYLICNELSESIYIPSENIAFLFEHGALGIKLYNQYLFIVDYLSFSKEAGCIIKPNNTYDSNENTLLWERNGFVAYLHSQDR